MKGHLYSFDNGVISIYFQRLRQLMEPENWGPGEKKYRESYQATEKPRARGFKEFLWMNLLGSWNEYSYPKAVELAESNGAEKSYHDV